MAETVTDCIVGTATWVVVCGGVTRAMVTAGYTGRVTRAMVTAGIVVE